MKKTLFYSIHYHYYFLHYTFYVTANLSIMFLYASYRMITKYFKSLHQNTVISKEVERQKWEANGVKTSIILFLQTWERSIEGTCYWVNLQDHIFELSIRVKLNRGAKLQITEEKANTWTRRINCQMNEW